VHNSTIKDLHKQCNINQNLEQLVHTTGTRLYIFMLYHDDTTKMIVEHFAYCKDWVFPVNLRQTKYMESIIYKDLFTAENVTRWMSEVDYVLVCTYRHGLNISIEEHKSLNIATAHYLSSSYIVELLTSAVQQHYDVIPLETTPEYKVLTSLIRHHTHNALKAWKAWNTVLLRMNFTTAEMWVASDINAFWRSSYLIRPAVLLKLSSLMSQAIDIVDNPAYLSLQTYFQKDAVGNPLVPLKVL
jgi:hypothetical protein